MKSQILVADYKMDKFFLDALVNVLLSIFSRCTLKSHIPISKKSSLYFQTIFPDFDIYETDLKL